MSLSAILSVLGLGFMIYVLFALAVYALPFFVAVTVGSTAVARIASLAGPDVDPTMTGHVFQ